MKTTEKKYKQKFAKAALRSKVRKLKSASEVYDGTMSVSKDGEAFEMVPAREVMKKRLKSARNPSGVNSAAEDVSSILKKAEKPYSQNLMSSEKSPTKSGRISISQGGENKTVRADELEDAAERGAKIKNIGRLNREDRLRVSKEMDSTDESGYSYKKALREKIKKTKGK